MNPRSFIDSRKFVTVLFAMTCVTFFVLIGCGNLNGDGSAGGGCTQTGGGGNDNNPDNDNTGVDNDNGSTGNDNVDDNDNEPAGGNENENDNDGGGTGGNDNGGSTGNGNSSTGGNDNGGSTNNDNEPTGNDNDPGTSNDNATGNTNTNTNTNNNTSSNTNSNTGGGGGTGNGNTGSQSVGTKTSGDERACAAAAVTCDTVTLSLADNVNAACLTNVQWSQNPADSIQVTLTPGAAGSGQATFTVPRETLVTTTTTLRFTVTAAGCPDGTTGSANVSIQIANANWNANLPACVEVGDTIDLDGFITVTGQPTSSLTLISVEDLPNEEDFNPLTNVLLPTAGGATVTVTLQVFGTAGLLDEAVETIAIQTTCP